MNAETHGSRNDGERLGMPLGLLAAGPGEKGKTVASTTIFIGNPASCGWCRCPTFGPDLWGGAGVGRPLCALIALGFVLIFKASGVFNFARGIMVVFSGLPSSASTRSFRLPGFPATPRPSSR